MIIAAFVLQEMNSLKLKINLLKIRTDKLSCVLQEFNTQNLPINRINEINGHYSKNLVSL